MFLSENTILQGGKYKIVRFLSSGGFGNTYEGVHTMMDTRVAIKEFFPKMFCNRDESTSHVTVATQGNRELVDKLRKKFNEEAKAVFQMKHENIVRVLDIFEENGTAYYVMEYIDGKSLNDITKERGALPESEAVGYILQVADALKYVHSLNRLHLDIKPGNIMIDKNGKALLIDFGASKHYDDESGENTSTLMGVNTKGYAPIEQSTKSFTSFSPATDIYALGATLYKLLTGIVPPDANLLLAEEETLQPLPNDISASTRNAVMAAMQFRRKIRPQSVDEFIKLLLSGKTGNMNTDSEETVIDEALSNQNEEIQPQKNGIVTIEKEQESAHHQDEKEQVAKEKQDRETVFDKNREEKQKLEVAEVHKKSKWKRYLLVVVGLIIIISVVFLSSSKTDEELLVEAYEYIENKTDTIKAVKIYNELAERNNVDALYYLGRLYFEGNTVKQDSVKAVNFMTRAANLGDAYAQKEMGDFYYAKHDYSNAVIWYKKASDQGYYSGQTALGVCYLMGHGVKQNSKTAVNLFEQANKPEERIAPDFYLSRCYVTGQGVEENYAKGVDLNIKAVNLFLLMNKQDFPITFDNAKNYDIVNAGNPNSPFFTKDDHNVLGFSMNSVTNLLGETVDDGSRFLTVLEVREMVKEFINRDVKNNEVRVALHSTTPMMPYLSVMHEIFAAYCELYEELAQKQYSKSFNNLEAGEQQLIQSNIPIKITLSKIWIGEIFRMLQ